MKRIFALGAAAALVAGTFMAVDVVSADQTIDNSAELNQTQSVSQTAGSQSNSNTAGEQSGSQTASATSSGADSQGNQITQSVGNTLLQSGFNGQTNAMQVSQTGSITQNNTQVAVDPHLNQTITNTGAGTQGQTVAQAGASQENTNAGAAQTATQDATADSSGAGSLGNLINQTVANGVGQAGENQQVNAQAISQLGTLLQTNWQGPQP